MENTTHAFIILLLLLYYIYEYIYNHWGLKTLSLNLTRIWPREYKHSSELLTRMLKSLIFQQIYQPHSPIWTTGMRVDFILWSLFTYMHFIWKLPSNTGSYESYENPIVIASQSFSMRRIFFAKNWFLWILKQQKIII